ncbi:hypothetical protein AMJ85_05555 [candidate division BRC1 bacterium SM23_51]|nr:MAG: hypothetical protein AMJ85_05555 [candidate division BRC1 bacterium SM23_51]
MLLPVLLILPWESAARDALDLTSATIVVRGDAAPVPEQTAGAVLAEEVERRTGVRWPIVTSWSEDGPVVVLASGANKMLHGKAVPERLLTTKPEGFAITTDISEPTGPVVWIVGADPRGALYGVGYLLRNLHWTEGTARLVEPLELATAPAYPIRGHQLGHRARANSYDTWDAAQYEQYIRELTFFGVNCVENIPFQGASSPLMKVPRNVMNRELSAICERYGLDYWVWTPAPFDLNDTDHRSASLDEHEAFYAACPRLDAVFFPGGDPGDNHPKLVMLFLEDLSKRLAKYHPRAKIWISLQGFNRGRVNFFYGWLAEHEPDWLGGIVAGPSSPPIPATRKRLPKRYGLRHYPDITHTVRCQYPVAWWDPAFAFTLGREPVNPQPLYYAAVHNFFAPYTDGFLTYSDGVNDDVNKTVWSALGWDPAADVRDVLVEYCRLFFGAEVAEQAADGILALERNWEGPLATNGGVDATLALWQALDAKVPHLRENWRWQLCLLRAYYDAYTRHRLIYETELEQQANDALAEAATLGADAAMDKALAILKRADTERCRPQWRARVVDLCDELFHSIGLQTSVEKYHASGAERGAVLDYLDFPLNNRWWLEDEIAKARATTTEKEKLARLDMVRTWENPGPGSFYDDIGNVAKSPHVIRGEGINTDPNMERNPNPDFMWWDSGKRRVRQSWVSKMDWPLGLRYDGLAPEATYVVRTTGYGQCLLRVDRVQVKPTVDGKDIGETKEFPVPKELYEDGSIVLTFDAPFEPHLNWRVQSRLSEVWLIKR